MRDLDEAELAALAKRMLADYDAATPGTAFAEGLQLSVADGWRVQAAVAELREARGERLAGYKIGCVDLGNRQSMGLPHPAYGRLWAHEQHLDGAELRLSDYANPAMEAEFAITLSRDVIAGVGQEELLASIEAIYPVIEIHNLVLRSEDPRGAELLANNAINAGSVRGAPVADLSARTTDLKLIYDGEVVDEWEGLTWPSDMLQAIGWLVEQLAEQGKALKAGDLILTGAFGPPIPLNGPRRVDVTSSAFGSVSATFA
ncbi:MAG: fumarylacetoacetate hydrolase family protein [Pseudomonadota bacterium]